MKTLSELIDEKGKPRKFNTLEEFQKAHEWEGLIPGDVVKFEGDEYLYFGFVLGPPGCPGAVPNFIPKNPKGVTLYVSDELPVEGHSEDGRIRMIMAERWQFEKIKYMTPEEWNGYVKERSD